jgi:proteasome lid subunit RPN8/RPN11
MPEPASQSAPNRLDVAGRKVGLTYADAVAIRIHEPVLEEILDYSEQDLRRELGGFLLGPKVAEGQQHVEIRRFWPAVDARSQAAALTFTHETWSGIHRALDERFPDDCIVGWQHTHPGLGVFLSGYDLFIHRNYFREPWQVALVVDPRSHDFGFFEWRQGNVVDCGFYCIASAAQAAAPHDAANQAAANQADQVDARQPEAPS